MTSADLLLAAMVLGVAIFLARGSHPLLGLLLVVSAVAVSALLFLPTRELGAWIGMGRVHWFHALAGSTPLDPAEWIHLLAFAWLGLLLWLGRADLRNWKGWALLVALGVGSELAQTLTQDREPRLADVVLNLAGGVAGVLLAMLVRRIVRWL